MAKTIPVTFEVGEKKTFAAAVDWPGWCRAGKDGDAALQALLDYAPRYARVMALGQIAFPVPAGLADFTERARAAGNKTTDFGAPNVPLPGDDRPVEAAELAHLQAVLWACWQALDGARQAAAGKELRKGPRGGGRDLDGVVSHVLEAEKAYLSALGWKTGPADPAERLAFLRDSAGQALAASARGELPKQGPRGGKIWPARVYARRSAWHILDHAWEIEDRVIEE